MKTLIDGSQVSSKSYYYLLEFNDNDNWQFMASQFGKNKLKDLTIDEYRLLFDVATQEEFITPSSPKLKYAIIIASGLSREDYLSVRSRLELTQFAHKPDLAKIKHELLEPIIHPFGKPPKLNRLKGKQ